MHHKLLTLEPHCPLQRKEGLSETAVIAHFILYIVLELCIDSEIIDRRFFDI